MVTVALCFGGWILLFGHGRHSGWIKLPGAIKPTGGIKNRGAFGLAGVYKIPARSQPLVNSPKLARS